MKKLLLMMTMLAIAVVPGKALADNIVLEYNDLASVLSGYHGLPDADYWKKLDPDATRKMLIAISIDQSIVTITRARALLALVNFPGDETSAHLSSATTDDNVAYMRASACEAYGKLAGEKGVAVIKRALVDKSTMVKIQAVRSLEMIGGKQARLALQSGMTNEKDADMKAVMERSLSKMVTRGAPAR